MSNYWGFAVKIGLESSFFGLIDELFFVLKIIGI